jgi:hypothetical protein
MSPEATTEVPIGGLPHGVRAILVEQMRPNGEGKHVPIRTKSGRRRKVKRVNLVADGADGDAEAAITTAGEALVLGANSRRWSTIESALGDRAWSVTLQLVRAGVVCLRCSVKDLKLERPQRWVLTESYRLLRQDREVERADLADEWISRAAAAADYVEPLCAALADALRNRQFTTTLPVLVNAAEDLVAGIVHDGPRAFSQMHFGDTKERDDVAQILVMAGVPVEVLEQLGVRRSSRIGVAGPVIGSINGQRVGIGLLDGPIIIRADQPGLILQHEGGPHTVVIVENLQAAETLTDRFDDLIVIYTAGPPSRHALEQIRQLTDGANRVLIVPDADLGGVRIAERLLTVVPSAELIDIGEQPHPVSDQWSADSESIQGLRAATAGPARGLAEACLLRGYRVEQELATVGAVSAMLG